MGVLPQIKNENRKTTEADNDKGGWNEKDFFQSKNISGYAGTRIADYCDFLKYLKFWFI